MSTTFNTPILFMVFNRPNTTKLVFNSIRQIKPKQLFIACDGPRSFTPGDLGLVKETQEVIKNIDWDCQVQTLFQTKNLGCKMAVSTAINWFFSHVEEGIILEDDCLPDLSFYPYCSELLNYYRDNQKIMHISGNNFQFKNPKSDNSYYFSIFSHCWGWATWKRAWEKFDLNMDHWQDFAQTGGLRKLFLNNKAYNYFYQIMESTYNNKINTWDYIWNYSIWIKGGLSILPKFNLVSNIGFSTEGTHTINKNSMLANLKTNKIDLPLMHPNTIIQNSTADNFTFNYIFKPNILNLIKMKFFKKSRM